MAVPAIEIERLTAACNTVREALLAERTPAGHWVGELSTSSLSTATAVMALEMLRRDWHRTGRLPVPSDERAALLVEVQTLIDRGLAWLASHQNQDGGWGDTSKSVSNISTAMLARAAFHAAGADELYQRTVSDAAHYIDQVGGVRAVRKRYGRDHTFSVPILTQCALAGLVEWRDVPALPFELACLPPRFYKTVKLPVVSYALPALIAIGQVRFHFRKPRLPPMWLMRKMSVAPSLRQLEKIQPGNGGFLEATPLTSFVTMSLAGMGRSDHPVAVKGFDFIRKSVREDGSWPIDTNLATWVTTLAVNALGDDLPSESRPAIRDWLRGQQWSSLHPYTNADPGGWAWTDLPGGVPDADDTPGAILALLRLGANGGAWDSDRQALAQGVKWLLDLQNRDGGWPTFCRGWGKLPFDRSSNDITAHALRALHAWRSESPTAETGDDVAARAEVAIARGFRFLEASQRPDGSWLPLWFGNQHAPDDVNPTYGTTKVLAAYRATGRESVAVYRGVEWLRRNQNGDGGWGGGSRTASSIEETSLAVEALLGTGPNDLAVQNGLHWLVNKVERGTFREATPIGFYFAKLWYFEKLYPLIFLCGCLREATFRRSTEATEVDSAARSGAGGI